MKLANRDDTPKFDSICNFFVAQCYCVLLCHLVLSSPITQWTPPHVGIVICQRPHVAKPAPDYRRSSRCSASAFIFDTSGTTLCVDACPVRRRANAASPKHTPLFTEVRAEPSLKPAVARTKDGVRTIRPSSQTDRANYVPACCTTQEYVDTVTAAGTAPAGHTPVPPAPLQVLAHHPPV